MFNRRLINNLENNENLDRLINLDSRLIEKEDNQSATKSLANFVSIFKRVKKKSKHRWIES